MEDKSNQKSENPNLNEVEWPKDADNQTHELKQKSCNRKNHNFKYTKKANEVKCECGIGYILAAGMEIWPDGHIYYNMKLVI